MQEKNGTQNSVHARSIEDAARSIGVGRTTLYELIAAKTIRTFRIGKRTLISESELKRFVSERMEAAA